VRNYRVAERTGVPIPHVFNPAIHALNVACPDQSIPVDGVLEAYRVYFSLSIQVFLGNDFQVFAVFTATGICPKSCASSNWALQSQFTFIDLVRYRISEIRRKPSKPLGHSRGCAGLV
jgi:hypothetical protein